MSETTPDFPPPPADGLVRTRFAPSPSGHLHVGGARTALFCWAYARGQGGKFILRIEDTDRKRSSDASSMAFLEDLAWLGIGWDEGPEHADENGSHGGGAAAPYRQSERLEIHTRVIQRLVEEGKAYPAFETPEELEAARKQARAEKRAYRYDGPSSRIDPDEAGRRMQSGEPHVIRVRVPDDLGEVTFRDAVLGDVTVAAEEIDDFVIRKGDGWPTYHLAVVVDDEAMGVTHVVRAQEHLYNTPKHVVLQQLLGYRRPTYAHVSVISNPDGSKMSKRDKDKALRAEVKRRDLAFVESVEADTFAEWVGSKDKQLPLETCEALAAELGITLPEINVDDFRRAGYLPEVVINYLALLGWSPGNDVEKFDAAFLCENFGLDRIVKSAAKFDRDKLLAFNLDALQAMDEATFATRLRAHAERYHPAFLEALGGGFELFASSNRERSKTLEDPFRTGGFFVVADDELAYESTKPVRKALAGGPPSGLDHLEAVEPILAGLADWTAEAIEEAMRVYAEAHAEGKLGKVAQPLRVAVSGGTVSPPIFETLVLLGRERTLARIARCREQAAAGAIG